MPEIYDNINSSLADGLRKMLRGARRADFCVGYFNLRGWGRLRECVDELAGEDGDFCRLLIGMALSHEETIYRLYSGDNPPVTQQDVVKTKRNAVRGFVKQLETGNPSADSRRVLRHLARQINAGRLKIKIHARHALHAKLYIAHRADAVAALAGFVGSSNLTMSGLSGGGELNVDVVEQDAAQKLAEWFNDRWNDKWSLDISEDVAEVIRDSWAGDERPPYHIYLKTAWHLSREAVEEAGEYRLPREFDDIMMEHQKQAVKLAAQRLNRQNGVIIGDVVGLGKTLTATAVAKIFQEDRNCRVLIICPPGLMGMWEDYLRRYDLTADVMSLGQVARLEKGKGPRLYHLVVIDEAHNLRNRKSARHRHVRDYIHRSRAQVIMLTATPYNKAYEDIGAQLLLFNGADEDLPVMPDALIRALGGPDGFGKKHPNTLISSLAAFEKSGHADDWRELMRLFMVRRTRAHIKQNYAAYDKERERYYLTLPGGGRFYFPKREALRMGFRMTREDARDQYAKLYSDEVVGVIESLLLPRYGLQNYTPPPEKCGGYEDAIRDLSRAGARLRGFARVGLFKRLESSGEAFICSLRRHIIRNAAMVAAYEAGAVYVGEVTPGHMGAAGEEDDSLNGGGEEESAAAQQLEDKAGRAHTWEEYKALGRDAYALMRADSGNFARIPAAYFNAELVADLQSDCEALLRLLNIVPQWDAAQDRKLAALKDLCGGRHAADKVLVFTQFKDTAKYIHRHLAAADARLAHGGLAPEAIRDAVERFSPIAAGIAAGDARRENQIRLLITTDKLSEGVNLQDAHVIVNYDLPWAIIRLIQRAGRVDRIGQRADTIRCYSAMPEDGVEKIIRLRERLQRRMRENEDLVGSDEVFFGEKSAGEVRQIYAGEINLEKEEDEDDTDLVSRAHDIWRRAAEKDAALAEKIKAMPNVVYSAKAAAAEGVIAYIKDARGQNVLAKFDAQGNIVSHSQYRLLEEMACAPETPAMPAAENHDALVAAAVRQCRDAGYALGGQLGGARSIRRRLYDRLNAIIARARQNPLLTAETAELEQFAQQIHGYPLKEAAGRQLARQLQLDARDEHIIAMLKRLARADNLCAVPQKTESKPKEYIICSMGMRAGKEKHNAPA